jgi:hypothetical protein
MYKKDPKIRGECAALAPYFRYSFANCVSPGKKTWQVLAEGP